MQNFQLAGTHKVPFFNSKREYKGPASSEVSEAVSYPFDYLHSIHGIVCLDSRLDSPCSISASPLSLRLLMVAVRMHRGRKRVVLAALRHVLLPRVMCAVLVLLVKIRMLRFLLSRPLAMKLSARS